MKKIITIISIILIALMFTGCSRRSATKSVRLDYIKENDGFTFKNYAIAIDDKKDNKNTYAVYKKIKSNKYQRLFRLDEEMLEIKDEIKDAQKLFEVKSHLITSIMNALLTLMSLGKNAEASRYEKTLNKLIEEGEVWELNSLLFSVQREIEKYKD